MAEKVNKVIYNLTDKQQKEVDDFVQSKGWASPKNGNYYY